MVEVLTWGQAWPEGRATAHQVEHSVGLALLEGQLPSHHGVEDDTSGGMGFLGTAPPPLPLPLHPPPQGPGAPGVALTGSTGQPAPRCTSCS